MRRAATRLCSLSLASLGLQIRGSQCSSEGRSADVLGRCTLTALPLPSLSSSGSLRMGHCETFSRRPFRHLRDSAARENGWFKLFGTSSWGSKGMSQGLAA
eukprot:3111968-Pleurochrysis_carterae.AAC.3